MNAPGKVRRVVTGVNEAGRSYVLSDRLIPTEATPDGSFRRIGIWLTDTAPASNEGKAELIPDGNTEHVVPQGKGGTAIRIVDIPPEREWAALPSLMTSNGVVTDPARSARHPGFHKTATVDYAVCLEGEVWMLLDEGETVLRAGDVIVQRGTYHAWSNRSDRVCRVLIVMVDADPLSAH
jgi:hypothetical protein